MRCALFLMAILACSSQVLGARLLKTAAGTPDDLAAEHPEVAKVLYVIKALGVLPSGQLDAGLTDTLPTNDAVDKLVKGLGLSLPSDEAGIVDFLGKLGPLKDILTAAILHNISPGTPEMPTDGNTVTLDTLADATVDITAGSDGSLTAKSPGNAKPVTIDDVFDWNGAQIIVTEEVLTPKAPLTSITPVSPEEAKAKISDLVATLPDMAGMAPAMGPAMAPAMGPAMGPAMAEGPSEAMMFDMNGDGDMENVSNGQP